MAKGTAPNDGFNLLDGVALVIGSAVASVHLRALTDAKGGGEFALFWITFTGVALTSAGPFLYLARRFVRRTIGYPGVGDRLWAILGLPWGLTVTLGGTVRGARSLPNDLYVATLGAGLAVASLVALGTVWKTWVMDPPEEAKKRPPSSWTDRIGLVLAVAWPLQCGFGLMLIG